MVLNPEWRQRISHWINTMPRLFYAELGSVEFEGFTTMDQLTAEQAVKRQFKHMPPGTEWGAKWEYAWFRAKVAVPGSAAGRRIVLKTDSWPNESAVYVDGINAGANDHFHRYLTLARKAKGGEKFDVLIEAYAGHGPLVCGGGPCPDGVETVPEPPPMQTKAGCCSFGIWFEEVYQLWLDAETLFQLRECIADKESLRVAEIDDALKEMTLVVDLELPREEMMETVRRGRAVLKPLLDAKNGSTAPFMHCFGHSHIDVAWLWPLRETESKCARTFGTQLALMEEYPEFKFLQSQCHLYWMVKNHYPKLYARIKEAAKNGQWIPDGGMWVESDTNVTSGESLIRQFIHGKRFYKEEFGFDSEMMWLPDVFGYSGALPQIMGGCGIKYFSTQKIFWNYPGGDKFPYNLFWWEGIDGSRVLSYFHNDYNSMTDPKSVFTRWNERVQKDTTHPGRLMPFGHGDGGGGPTRDHIEFLRRMKDLQGAPKCHIGTPAAFFKKAKTEKIPAWFGELYFQAHRGTYTSQAKTKKGNRKCEFALREAELWGAAASALAKFAYPLEQADSLWKAVLLNQFHDIIPGSSIARVYVEAEALHADVIAKAGTIAGEARLSMAKQERNAATVFNSLSWSRDGVVELPPNFKGAEDEDGQILQTQKHDGRVFALVGGVPSCGWRTVRNSAIVPPRHGGAARATKNSLENELVKAVFNSCGELVSFTDKKTGIDIAAGTCNRLRLYKDVPGWFDAWDIDSIYKLQPVEIPAAAEIHVGAEGPIFASITVRRKFGKSELSQEIVLRAGSRRLDFRTVVEWRESHKLLKVNFPVNVRSEDALHEIQFGHIRRPTHSSKQYDADKFEVCNYKWTALAEENRGAAVLNDCKYGVNVEKNSINLTLLKSALAPDMTADKGRQEFTYSFYFWEGPLASSRVVQESYDLNVPLSVEDGAAGRRELFGTDSPSVIVETVKPAEDGSGDIVVRLYESARSSVDCEFRTSLPVKTAAETDMLEREKRKLKLSSGAVNLSFRPFEIKTLRLKVG